MKWRGRRGSGYVEDRRGSGNSGGRRVSGAGGIGGVGVIAILVIGYFLGVDVTPLLQQQGDGFETTQQSEISAADQQAGQFVSVVLADTEEVWTAVFADQLGERYQPAVLVLYAGQTSSPCGGASGATGPFYCPGDNKIYLDTNFFVTLSERLGAGGDFAAAYVVAHEVAHHVQNEIGILAQANAERARVSQERSNAISVRVELQADCFAGIWTREAQARFDVLERGDLEEALNAAKQIGDDTLQRNAGRQVQPHTFTHGTSAQRQRWFSRGYESGDLDACNTFATDQL